MRGWANISNPRGPVPTSAYRFSFIPRRAFLIWVLFCKHRFKIVALEGESYHEDQPLARSVSAVESTRTDKWRSNP